MVLLIRLVNTSLVSALNEYGMNGAYNNGKSLFGKCLLSALEYTFSHCFASRRTHNV
jgi:hypothetical protein